MTDETIHEPRRLPPPGRYGRNGRFVIVKAESVNVSDLELSLPIMTWDQVIAPEVSTPVVEPKPKNDEIER